MEKIRYVIDTDGLISFFSGVFDDTLGFDGAPSISQKARAAIQEAVFPLEGLVLLSVPSIVFIEIYEKWLRSGEFFRKFFYEVFIPIISGEEHKENEDVIFKQSIINQQKRMYDRSPGLSPCIMSLLS